MKPWFCLILLGFSCTLWAEDFYAMHAKGWHWYDDPLEHQEVEKEATQNPVETLNTIKQSVQAALDKALLLPSKDNVENYIKLQNQMSERATLFATTWQEVLRLHPELNFSLMHPTNALGIKVYQEEQSKREEKLIKAFSEHMGLFFFYKSTCPYCRRFSPILDSFAKRYGINVIPITLDGMSLPEFPNSKKDSGQAQQFKVTLEPSVFAVDPYTGKAYPVAFGLVSESELHEAIVKIMQLEQGRPS